MFYLRSQYLIFIGLIPSFSTRGNEVESEAMALCRLGVLYDKVFKLRYYSKPCFRRVIQLGLTMTPRNVTNECKSPKSMGA